MSTRRTDRHQRVTRTGRKSRATLYWWTLALGALLLNAGEVRGQSTALTSDDALQQTCEAEPGFDLRYQDPQLAAAFDRTSPDFRPAAGSAATQNALAVPAGDTWFTAVDFIGAVGAGAAEWYEGWTTFAQN